MTAIPEKAFYDLVGRMYETATQSSGEGWAEIFDDLSRLLSAGPGSLHFYIHRTERFELIADTNHEGFQDDFNSIYFPILPFRENLLNLKPGEIFVRTRDFSDDEFKSSELYQQHFKQLGIYHVIHANLMDGDGASAGISFTRPESMREFDTEDLDAFSFILPHLQRAMRLHVRLLEAEGREALFEEAWNRVPQGIAIAKESGAITFKNTAAERFFAPNGPLRIGHGGSIEAVKPGETEDLRAAIRSVFSPDISAGRAFGGTVQISTGHPGRKLALLVTPFTTSYGTSGLFEPLAMIFIADPSAAGEASFETDLGEVFGLTQAESRIAILLAEGNSINDIANRLGITQSTARTHLKRIFTKTRTHRQGSLVKLILAMPRLQRNGNV